MRNRSLPKAFFTAAFLMVTACAGTSNQVTEVKFSQKNGMSPSGPVEFVLPQTLESGVNWTLRDPATGGHYPLQILNREVGSTRVLAILPDTASSEGYQLAPFKGDFPMVKITDDSAGKVAVRYEPHAKPNFVLNYDKEWAKPFIYPFLGVNDVPLTRGFPMDPQPDDSNDHPHHKSFWTAYGNVNGVDFWTEGGNKGRQVVRTVSVESGPVAGLAKLDIDWVVPDGKTVLKEKREYHFYNTSDDARLFDVVLHLTAVNGDAHFGDTKEAGFVAIRVKSSMRGDHEGLMTNSEGLTGEKNMWGKPANWVDYSGPVEGVVNGVTLMDYPENPGHPARWHARDYGLLGCNNIAVRAFDKKAEAADYVIPEGETRTFRYRVLVHKGGAKDVAINSYYKAFTAGVNVELSQAN